MEKTGKKEKQQYKRKRQLFPENLRDRLNRVPEDIREIYRLQTDSSGRLKVCSREDNGWHLMSRTGSLFHRSQNSAQGREAKYNRKFVRPDGFGGSSEAVICFPPGKQPYLVTDPVNRGTYNFISPVRGTVPAVTPSSLAGHFRKDVLPHLIKTGKKSSGGQLRREEK